MHPSRGRLVDDGGGIRTVYLDPRLDQRQRNATLTHELVHDELDLLWRPGTPPWIVARGERIVDGISTDRLVPPCELAAWVEQRCDLEAVVAWQVAEEWEVPIEVADLALRRLAAGF